MLVKGKVVTLLAIAALTITMTSPGLFDGEARAEAGKQAEAILLEKNVVHTDFSDDRSELLLSATRDDIRVVNGKRYSAVARTVEDYTEERILNIRDKCDILRDYAEEFRDELGESLESYENSYSYLPFVLNENIILRRADKGIISILEDFYFYAGGAHGMYSVHGKAYDVNTGKELTINDVITDKRAFSETVAKELIAAYPDSGFANPDSGFANPEDSFFDGSLVDVVYKTLSEGNLSWGIEPEGVAVYFNPYDIASYAEGIITTTVKFKDYPKLFQPKYKNIPQNYAVELSSLIPVSIDDGAGKYLRLEVVWYDKLSFMINGIEVLGDTEAMEGARIYLLALEDGRNYIYADCDLSDGTQELRVYELSGVSVRRLPGSRQLSLMERSSSKNDTVYPITDPQYFRLFGSTDSANRYYRVGTDGWPEAIR